MKIKLSLTILLSFYFGLLSSQVKVRLFTEFTPDYAIFTAKSGKYQIRCNTGRSIAIPNGEPILIALYNNRIFAKLRNGASFLTDSVEIKGETPEDFFTLRINESGTKIKTYSGDLKCFSDLETLLLINTCDIEKYIAGVVKAEGGGGRSEEYFKTQAVIARTYTYRYFNKHIIDRYNLCDDTHCQSFSGITGDSLIINAVRATKDMVITTPDSILIISAFHSNCGGETSPSEYVWVTDQPYLKRIVDTYCLGSRNALWDKKISLTEWTDFLKKNGYSGTLTDPSVFNFNQTSRVPDYIVGSFSIPLHTIRTGLNLKSSYFSVYADSDSLLLKGKGYGHGVGLCQEGAMIMSLKGFKYEDIINFYYTGVKIMKIGNTRKSDDDKLTLVNH
jgi:stage II sporulation protein D